MFPSACTSTFEKLGSASSHVLTFILCSQQKVFGFILELDMDVSSHFFSPSCDRSWGCQHFYFFSTNSPSERGFLLRVITLETWNLAWLHDWFSWVWPTNEFCCISSLFISAFCLLAYVLACSHICLWIRNDVHFEDGHDLSADPCAEPRNNRSPVAYLISCMLYQLSVIHVFVLL